LEPRAWQTFSGFFSTSTDLKDFAVKTRASFDSSLSGENLGAADFIDGLSPRHLAKDGRYVPVDFKKL
jgi:hypothetical protein